MYRFASNQTSGVTLGVVISGRRLTPNKMTPSRRAGIAAQIIRGEIVLASMTVDQACRLTGACSGYVKKALQANAREREALAQGRWGMSGVKILPKTKKPEPRREAFLPHVHKAAVSLAR